MSLRDLVNHIAAGKSLAAIAREAAASGSAVDTRGYDSAAFLLRTETVTDGVFTFVPQESDTTTDTDFTAVAAADLDGTLPTVDGNASPAVGGSAVTLIGYKGTKRYLRVRVTVASLPSPSSGAIIGGDVLLGHPHVAQ